MSAQKNCHLRASQKLDILVALFSCAPIRPILDGFDDRQLVQAHEFVWNKLVEIHYLTQDGEFLREAVTRKMLSSASYQHKQNCDLRLDYCKGVECILSNPICAGNKVKNNMEVMALTITGYLNARQPSAIGFQNTEKEEAALALR